MSRVDSKSCDLKELSSSSSRKEFGWRSGGRSSKLLWLEEGEGGTEGEEELKVKSLGLDMGLPEGEERGEARLSWKEE